MTRDPTPDQLRGIATSGRDVCVVAGAGTGKTFVLTERVVRRVLEDGVQLPQILAITFTEKAAAEMKERLAKALAARGRATAREDVESAAVSTVHAFCARLLREHAIEAGVDPAFEVLDEVAADRLLLGALDAFVGELGAADPATLEVLAGLGGDDPAETLLDVLRAARAAGGPVGAFVRRSPELRSVADALRDVRDAVGGVRAVADRGTDAGRSRAKRVLDASAGLPELPGDPAVGLAAVAAVAAAVNLQCGEPVKSALAEVRAAAAAAASVFAEIATAPLRERLATAIERLDALYEDAKGRGRRLDFTDLERRALALLERRDDVAAHLRARRPEVLVDEYQDTNPVQASILERLRTPGRLFVVGDPKQSIYGFRGADVGVFERRLADAGANDPDGVVVLHHSFRSRPEILGFVERVFAKGVGGPLCSPVAGAAAAGAAPGSSADDPADGAGPGSGDVRLTAARPWAPAVGPCVDVLTVPCETLEEGRPREAAWIAARIVELTSGAFRVAAPTGDDPCATRPAGYDDVAILLRTTTHLKALEDALVVRDVPYVVVKGRGFFRAREVVDLANLLASAENPRDDLTFAAVLRSPAAGVSDDGLHVLCAGRSDGQGVSDVLSAWSEGRLELPDLAPDDARVLAAFADRIRELRRLRASAPLSALLDRAIDGARLDLKALARPNGRQRAANLRKVRVLARAAETSGTDLSAFVAELRDLREREVREAEAPLTTTGAVRILTVHAAKGLEFPIVVVPDVGRTERTRSGRIVAHSADGLGLRGGVSDDTVPAAYAAIHARTLQREQAESDRLLYVALTRAADHLVLTASLSGRSERRPWWERIAAAIDAASVTSEDTVVDVGARTGAPGGTRVAVRVVAYRRDGGGEPETPRTLLPRVARELAAGRVPARDLPASARAAADELLAEAGRTAPDPSGTPYAAPVSALLAFDRCPQEYRLRHVLGLPESMELAAAREPAAFTEDPDAAAAPERPGDEDEPLAEIGARPVGRAAHAALERLVPAFADDVHGVVTEALRAETGGAAPDPQVVARVVRWVEGFRDAPEGRRVRTVPRDAVRREQAFLLRAGPVVLRGQFDLVWHEDGASVVLDYKSADLADARPEHVLQMRLYGLAARALDRRAPRRLVLFSLPRARALEVPCDDAALDRLEQGLLAEFVDRTRRRDFAPRADPPCGACPWRGICAFSTERRAGTGTVGPR